MTTPTLAEQMKQLEAELASAKKELLSRWQRIEKLAEERNEARASLEALQSNRPDMNNIYYQRWQTMLRRWETVVAEKKQIRGELELMEQERNRHREQAAHWIQQAEEWRKDRQHFSTLAEERRANLDKAERDLQMAQLELANLRASASRKPSEDKPNITLYINGKAVFSQEGT